VGIEIERLTAATLAEADAVVVVAFGAPHSRLPELRRNLALEPDGWRLARVDGRAAGIGGAVVFGPFAYIGQVGVLPEFQRRGIASALMRELLAWLEARGCPVALLDASADGAQLYPHLGFVADDTVTVWRREEVPGTEPGTVSDARDVASASRLTISPLGAAELAEVAAFDAPHFSVARPAVLAAYLDEYARRAFVARTAHGALVGYLFAQALTLGPWVAASSEAARALLARALALPFAEPPQALTPDANAEAAPLLRAAGFAPVRTLQHMRRGGAPLLDRRRTTYGQASFALG
jgi:GNAT superfamily N-acetyltransferase